MEPKYLSNESDLVCVTLTGADDSTSIGEILKISNEYPFAEFAILWSKERQGTPRYPSREWISKLIEANTSGIINLALHICGAPNIEEAFSSSGEFPELLSGFKRVQLNFKYANHGLERLAAFIESAKCKVIIQDNFSNRGLYKFLHWSNCQILVDSSGGRGVLPSSWPIPFFHTTGYAGGLGPDNILEELEKIPPTTETPCSLIWVDMESKLRDEANAFDLNKCKDVLEKVYQEYK